MSLIEEALRRMKDPVLTAQPAPPPTTAHSWSATPPRTKRSSSNPETTNALLAVTLVVIALTVIFIACGVFWMVRTLNQHQTAPTAGVAPQPTAAAATPKPATSEGQAPPAAASPAPPTAPPAQATDATPAMSDQADHAEEELVLTGIVEGSGTPYAVINGSIVGVGEQIEGLTLLEIANGVVKVRRSNGSETALSLPK